MRKRFRIRRNRRLVRQWLRGFFKQPEKLDEILSEMWEDSPTVEGLYDCSIPTPRRGSVQRTVFEADVHC